MHRHMFSYPESIYKACLSVKLWALDSLLKIILREKHEFRKVSLIAV